MKRTYQTEHLILERIRHQVIRKYANKAVLLAALLMAVIAVKYSDQIDQFCMRVVKSIFI